MKYRKALYDPFTRPRANMTRLYVALAAVVVCWLGWSQPLGDPTSKPADSGTRILAPDVETGVMRVTPTVARARDLDRSIDRRPFQPLAAVVLLAGLAALRLTVTTTTAEGHKAFGAEPGSRLGSRAPPNPALA
ncbi:MAG: hypothetical protein ACRDJT_10230 [Actinomycetota bacterium]